MAQTMAIICCADKGGGQVKSRDGIKSYAMTNPLHHPENWTSNRWKSVKEARPSSHSNQIAPSYRSVWESVREKSKQTGQIQPCWYTGRVFKGTKVKIEELTSGGGNIQSARGFLILFCQQMSILLQMKQLWWFKNVKTHLLNAVICCQTCQL